MASPVQVKYTKLFINNEFVDAISGKTFPTINPATGEKIVDVASADKADVDKAVAAARKAFQFGSVWRRMDASARGHLMSKLADLMERDVEYLAKLETLDNGKPLTQALHDARTSVKSIRYYAGWADKIHGDTIPSDGNIMTITRKEPIGVVGQIIPWNFPIHMAAWKLGPALATGCTIILKPANQTSLTALAVAALTKEAGFPDGVVNIITGYGSVIGAALSSHMDVDKVAFTGSTEVGKLIQAAAANSNLKHCSLELGGKNPLIICADADLDKAAAIAHRGIFHNQGQVCCSATRTFVEASIYDKFVQKAKELAEARKIGDGFEDGVMHGPQIDNGQFKKILELIESGKQEGAKCVTGGKRWGTKGYFIHPTVFADVKDNMRIAQEEIFGPVQSILKFDTLDEAIKRANNTCYGLTSGIVTNDINKALKFAAAAEAGTVWVNTFVTLTAQTPFGGYKQSGIGRELGEEGLHEYLEVKTITIGLEEKL